MENDSDEKTDFRSLKKMKEKSKQKKQKEQSRHNLPFIGIYIYQNIIKEQNKKLLNDIAEYKFRCDEERELFVKKYLRINYHLPEIINDNQLELNQNIRA